MNIIKYTKIAIYSVVKNHLYLTISLAVTNC